MSYGQLSTVPPGVTMATSETIPYGVDMTTVLASIPGSSITGVSTVLQDTTLNVPVTLASSPTVAGNVVTQVVQGSTLVAGHSYELRVTFTAATSTVITVVLAISVPL